MPGVLFEGQPVKKKALAKKAAKKAKAPAKRKPAAKPRQQQNATAAPSKRDRRIDVFAVEYVIDFNGAKAAVRAGYNPATARFEACRMLALPEVQEKVDAAVAARMKRTELTADDVLNRIRAIATADANSLIEMRRTCCRHCYGKDHRYQRTPRELENHRRDFEAKIDKQCDDAALAAELKSEFDDEGGIGWDPRKEPVDNCPECFGQGVAEPFIKDTRELTPEAKMLYRGVKVTKDGLQVLTADQDAMLRLLAEHAGLLRRKVELTGKDGGPLKHTAISGILDEIDGSDTGLPAARHGEGAS